MEWTFNKEIAKKFNRHARQHIPDYERVLNLTINLCTQKLKKNSNILEIGCAIGETVSRLNEKGYKNVHAVDQSQDMLDYCPKDAATYYCSSNFPKIDLLFDAVLCNWTLHFIKNKNDYLKNIYNAMNSNSFLILSEKTENSGLALKQYHQWKSNNGVSDEEIQSKAKSLEGVLFVNSINWYLKNLKSIGFNEIYIANSTWCFTTFVAVKNN
jgi:tRNA (cmo5U34)-methyltransferase